MGALRLAPTGSGSLAFPSHNVIKIRKNLESQLRMQKAADGNGFEACLREGPYEHCIRVRNVKEAYTAQAALQRAIEKDKLAVVKWDPVAGEWTDGGDAA